MNDQFYKQDTLTDFTAPQQIATSFPAQIGPYKIESLINRSSMSLLYLGLHPQTRQMLAIKVLSPEFVSHTEMVERFLKEAKIIGMTNHPNIVKLYGQGEWEKGLYIAMEFIRGVSLKQFIVQQSLSLRRSIDIILQVAHALCHLHSHGVIHGDLKPENILITEDGEIKVIDFGIAKLHEEINKSSGKNTKITGTPNYMSPEQKEDPAKVSFASDIYSLGVIAYELIMGKLSFGIIHLSMLPKGLRKMIEKSLAISISERYQDILLFISDLSQYLKLGGLEKDRSDGDQAKELLETILSIDQTLSPLAIPTFPGLEIGIARYKSISLGGSYYDFFRFSDETYSIVLAESTLELPASTIAIAQLRGMIRTIAHQHHLANHSPAAFAETLQEILQTDPLRSQFRVAILHLNPMRNRLALIACGGGELLHLPQGQQNIRKILSSHTAIPSNFSETFMETVDSWDIGDSLLFHSLTFDINSHPMDMILNDAIPSTLLLSAQSQAESILKKLATHSAFPQQSNAKMLLAIHRMS